jgi:ABC-type transporter Mla MlaB component
MLLVAATSSRWARSGSRAVRRCHGKTDVALPFFGKKPASPAPAAERRATVAPEAHDADPPTELSGLDFTGTDHGRALAHAAGLVEVRECGSGIGAAFEEAAVLYANGSDAEALALLEAAVGDATGGCGEGAWLMLLDLYRLGGLRQRFESRVLDYATRFERSPPPWEDLSAGAGKSASGRTPLVNLSGQLSAAAERQFAQVAAIARRSGGVRIDVGKVRGVDDGGCGVWRRLLAELGAERVGVELVNVHALAEVLAQRLQAGRADARDSWLMLLELLQYGGDQGRFEDVAVDYAVTFEESPPSWERRGRLDAAPVVPARVAPPADPEGFEFDGELSGGGNETLKRFAAFAAERRSTRVECARLRRIDFVCAGTLFNMLATLQAQGKLVSLANVNAMVAGLLRVMSVDNVAHVTLRH